MSAVWRDQAACADCDEPGLFDPLGEKEPVEQMMERAKIAVAHYCALCPVVAECGAEAEDHEYLGIWAGRLRARRQTVDLLAGIVHVDQR